MPKTVSALLGVMMLPALIGCGNTVANNPKVESPEALLKFSMDQYHLAKGFSADESFKLSSPALLSTSITRTISYESPKRFRIVSEFGRGQVVTCTSDGTKELDYSSDPHSMAVSDKAPESLASPTASIMKNPVQAGSLLYLFFGGSQNIGMLEQQGIEPATWGVSGVAPSGEKTKQVKFLCIGDYGHATATIGVDSGLVYQLAFDSAPQIKKLLRGQTPAAVIQQMKDALPKAPAAQKSTLERIIAIGPSAFTMDAVDNFTNPTFGPVNKPGLFDTSLPKGYKLAPPPPPPPDGNAPVPMGSKAPDMMVQDSSGKPIRLSSLRGQVVMIDFWATWCGPCKAGLPFTAELGRKFANKGLKVLAVSAEPAATIRDFVKNQTYKLEAFNDPGEAATLTYHVNALPTTVVIDRKGNLVDYFQGLHDPSYIEQSLQAAGFNGG